MQELVKRGILFQGTFVASFMHREAEIEATLRAIDESLQIYRKALEAKSYRPYLVGPPIKPVFRKEN
jgi:glutamate-1-semialdehyde 2,1-aminomutase